MPTHPTSNERQDAPNAPATLRAKKKARETYEANRFFVINGKTLRFSPSLAREIGEREAYVLLQLEYWMATTGQEHEGRRCYHTSISELALFFDWWSRASTHRTIQSLEEQKLIETMTSPRGKHDGQFIFFNLEKITQLKSIRVDGYTPPPPVEDEDDAQDRPATRPQRTPGPDANSGANSSKNRPKLSQAETEELSHSETTPSHHETTPSQADTTPSHSETTSREAYKVRARDRAVESNERAVREAAPQSQSENAAGHDTRADAADEDFSNDNGGAGAIEAEVGSHIRADGSVFIAEADIATRDQVRALFHLPIDRNLNQRDREELAFAMGFVQEERLRPVDIEHFLRTVREKTGQPTRYVSRLYQNFHNVLPNFETQRRAHLRKQGAPQAAAPAVAAASQPTAQAPRGLATTPTSDKWNATPQRTYVCGIVLRSLKPEVRTPLLEAGIAQLSPFLRECYQRSVNNQTEPTYSVQRAVEEYAMARVWQEHHARCEEKERCVKGSPGYLPAIQLPGCPPPPEGKANPVAAAAAAVTNGWQSVGDAAGAAAGNAGAALRKMLPGVPIPPHILKEN